MTTISTTVYRLADARDAGKLSAFAAAKFIEAYRDLSPIDLLEAYTRMHFTEEKLRAEIEAANEVLLMAEHAGELIAYALLTFDSRPECAIDAQAPVQLQRIYVDPAWHGRGIARALLEQCIDIALQRSGDVLWLAVWPKNRRAVRFYDKSGFTIVGEQGFTLGDEVQLDHVMSLKLTESRAHL